MSAPIISGKTQPVPHVNPLDFERPLPPLIALFVISTLLGFLWAGIILAVLAALGML
jgi:hypothetical protein